MTYMYTHQYHILKICSATEEYTNARKGHANNYKLAMSSTEIGVRHHPNL